MSVCTFRENDSSRMSDSVFESGILHIYLFDPVSSHNYSISKSTCRYDVEFFQTKSCAAAISTASKPRANPNLAFPRVAVRGAENRASLVSWKRVTCKHLALRAGVNQGAYGLIRAKIRRKAVKMRIRASTTQRMERKRWRERTGVRTGPSRGKCREMLSTVCQYPWKQRKGLGSADRQEGKA